MLAKTFTQCALRARSELHRAHALYYRVRFKPFNLLWSLWTHGSVFYPDSWRRRCRPRPAYAAHTYGIRKRFITRHLNWHPDLLSVKCVPLERAPQ